MEAHEKKIQWLLVIAAVLALVCVVELWIIFDTGLKDASSSLIKLCVGVLPDIVASLLTVLLVFLALTARGIRWEPKDKSGEALQQSLEGAIDQATNEVKGHLDGKEPVLLDAVKDQVHISVESAAIGFHFRKNGARGAEGYLDFLSKVKRTIHMTHVDGDPPSKKVLEKYDTLLGNKIELNRLIFLQNPVTRENYEWIRTFGTERTGLTQNVISPAPAGTVLDDALQKVRKHKDLEGCIESLRVSRRATKPMLMSFAVVDHQEPHAFTAISLLRSPVNDDTVQPFDDLLIVYNQEVARAFYEIYHAMQAPIYARELSNDDDFKELIEAHYPVS